MIKFGWWLIISSIVFSASIILGTFLPFNFSIDDISPIGDLVDDLDSMSSPLVFVIILLNNITAVTVSFFLSPLLCIVPVLSLTLNGLIIGMVGALVVEQQSLIFLLAGILPHGILEIPALLIALAAGLNFGSLISLSLFKKSLRQHIVPCFSTNIKYLGLAVLLLIPAAFIESFITPVFLSLF